MSVTLQDAAALTNAFSGADALYALIPPAPQVPDVRGYQERVSDAFEAALRKFRRAIRGDSEQRRRG